MQSCLAVLVLDTLEQRYSANIFGFLFSSNTLKGLIPHISILSTTAYTVYVC